MTPISLITKFIPGSSLNGAQTSVEEEVDGAQTMIINKEEIEWGADSSTGELAVDVYETDAEIVVVSAIAGVSRNDINIEISNDMITIRGVRMAPDPFSIKNYLYKECYWGRFSRSIILPNPVLQDRVTAELSKGILIVHLPKSGNSQSVPIQMYEYDEDV